MEKILRTFIIISLVAAIALVAIIFIFWLPALQQYVQSLEGELPLFSDLVYPLSAIIALLNVSALGVALAFPSAMKKDQIFSDATASKLSLISLLLIISSAIIFACAALLLSIGDSLVAFPMIIIAAISLLASFMLNILSSYVKRAAELKQEVEATL